MTYVQQRPIATARLSERQHRLRRRQLLSRRVQLICLWAGIPMLILWFAGLVLAHFMAPPSPVASAQTIAHMYRTHTDRIRIWLAVSFFAFCWLSAVLCSATPGARVTSVTVGGGSVGTTTRRALQVGYNEAGAVAQLPERLFVKCVTTLAQRLMLGLGGLIDGEPSFYAHVRPGLEIEAPVGYFGVVDPGSWRSIVLIEDVVSTRGARFWQPSTRITREHIENLLTNVAVWHGALWDSPQLAAWRWLKTPGDQMRVIDALVSLADRAPVGAERARAVIPASLRERQADLYEGMRRSMQIASRGARSYLHGDLHIANTYVTPAGAMGVVDWQVGLQGSWAHDYAYIVTTALAAQDRRAWERELLDFYLEQLAAAGGETITPEQAWQAYRQATFYPYFAWLYTIGRSRLQPQFQPDEISLAVIERIATAIDDLDSLGAVGL
jgi:Phosphotransferase enzyme family